ncbi:hypothetical protein [Streptomyces lavendulocolor]|uniref:hypothetical protein n=1 Tax=Streptomyces lavendulocolor TaxID=67316 RepID=UPI003C2ED1A6
MPNFILTLFTSFLLASSCAWLIFVGMAHLTGADVGILPGRDSSIPPSRLFDLTRSTVTAAGLLAGVFAIVYAYRKQKIDEAGSHRADADSLGTRYQEAAEKLGSESATVRLAGIYALSALADQDSAQRETICRLLCGYLRMPYAPGESSPGEREVRHSVIKVIAEHLQDPESDFSWCGYDLDFSGAVFDGGSFAGSHFVNCSVSFSGCSFAGGKTVFDRSTIADAHVDFGDGESVPAVIDGGLVHFIGVRFKAGSSVSFIFAEFRSGSVEFGTSEFLPGSIMSFSACELHDAFVSFGGPTWQGAKFLGGGVHFSGAKFEAGALSFMGAKFAGSHIGLDDIEQVATSIIFDDAEFISGRVTFKDSKLSGRGASFSGESDPGGVVSPWPLPVSSPRRRRARRRYGWRSRPSTARDAGSAAQD